MTDDIIIGHSEPVEVVGTLDIIENQIMLINEVNEWSVSLYDTMDEDRIKVVNNAFKLIAMVQRKLMKSI